jgi:uncharacterized protein YndB with AHSA1/START domain
VALTNPDQRIEWWGFEGRFQITHMESDLRGGAKWSMRGIGMGKPFEVKGEYRQIDRPRLLVFRVAAGLAGEIRPNRLCALISKRNGGITSPLDALWTRDGKSAEQSQRMAQILSWLQAYAQQQA